MAGLSTDRKFAILDVSHGVDLETFSSMSELAEQAMRSAMWEMSPEEHVAWAQKMVEMIRVHREVPVPLTDEERGAATTPQPLPGALVIKALHAMDDEARSRGRMYPQTADEQEADTKAVRRVISSLEFYTTGRQVGTDGWPSVAGWPALPNGGGEA